MSDDSKRTLFSTESASRGSEPSHGAPLKAWVTPKVITSTLSDTETAAAGVSDGATALS
jgi:hypothetical protein